MLKRLIAKNALDAKALIHGLTSGTRLHRLLARHPARSILRMLSLSSLLPRSAGVIVAPAGAVVVAIKGTVVRIRFRRTGALPMIPRTLQFSRSSPGSEMRKVIVRP